MVVFEALVSFRIRVCFLLLCLRLSPSEGEICGYVLLQPNQLNGSTLTAPITSLTQELNSSALCKLICYSWLTSIQPLEAIKAAQPGSHGSSCSQSWGIHTVAPAATLITKPGNSESLCF